MAALTFDNIITIAEVLLNAEGDLNWSSTQKNTLADMANREVWDVLIASNPAWVSTRTSFTWPANTDRLDLTGASYLNAEPKLIIEVFETPNDADPSDTNLPWPWTPATHQQRYRRRNYRPYSWWGRVGRPGQQAYSLAGNYIHGTPVPTSARYVHVEWVPQVTVRASGSTEVLSGQAELFGDVVATRLAYLMNMKDNHNPEIPALWAEAKERIALEASKRQVQRNRIVGSESWL